MHPSLESLVPGIDRRLSAWISIKDKLRHEALPSPKPTITLSRRFGCEAYPVAERLKEILEERTRDPWLIYDRALLARVASDENLSMTLLESVGDDHWKAESLASYLFPRTSDQEALFAKMPKYILSVARMGNAIIVGRGGAILTQRLSNCFHYRLEAPLEFRAQSTSRRLEITLAEAEALVRRNEKLREQFIEKHLGERVDNPLLYHLVINNARHSIDDIATMITENALAQWARFQELSARPQAH
jgi:cytidylate kinase